MTVNSGETYEITVRVGVEEGNPRQTMRVHAVLIRDHFPPSPSYHRNFAADGESDQVSVSAGTCRDLLFEFDIPASWDEDEVKIIAWGEPVRSSAPAPTLQAAIMHWPFNHAHVMGDFDGNSEVDVMDFAAFGVCMNGPESETPFVDCVTAFDFDSDEDVDILDYQAFQTAFHTGEPVSPCAGS